MVIMSVEARTGRERQLYENGCRLVAGCVPYRWTRSKRTAIEDDIEVLMISSPNRRDLVFPKGGWEKDETVYQAAAREALEEAGIIGTIHEKELGTWESRSKSSEISRSPLGACLCHFFAMEVKEELDSWPEQAYHERRWVSVDEARRLCRYKWMEEALDKCLEFLGTPARERPETPAMAAAVPKCRDSVRSAGAVLCTSSLS